MPSKVRNGKSSRCRKKKENNEPTLVCSKIKIANSLVHQSFDKSLNLIQNSDNVDAIMNSKSRENQQLQSGTYKHVSNSEQLEENNKKRSLLSSSVLVNKKITDYFQIRKSTRKCKSDLEKEKRIRIENAIRTMNEDGLEVRSVPNKGRGVFSTRYFERGEFVCEYAGEMISYKTAKKREELYSSDPNIGCYMYFFDYKCKSYCIDATAETNRLGRLLNHSKTGGNCHTKLFEMESQPHLILVASRDIKPGEELTYDYGDRTKLSLKSHPWLAY